LVDSCPITIQSKFNENFATGRDDRLAAEEASERLQILEPG